MNYLDTIHLTEQGLQIRSLLPESGIAPARDELIKGLSVAEKYISSKFFYNQRGSELYEEITRLDEYYPTRTEKAILAQIAPLLMRSFRGFDLIELGPGDASKISYLLRASDKQQAIHYLPMDISESALRKLVDELAPHFPNLEVDAWVMDFTRQLGMIQRNRPALICFFGSTIGNFSREQSRIFIRKLAGDMKKGDHLLLGMDLVKSEEILHAAYNDQQGITAAFNLNILQSVNDILESDFREEDFNHLAFFNTPASRMEMHLEAKRNVQLHSPYLKEAVMVREGERIHTENSHKFNEAHITDFAVDTGLHLRKVHKDPKEWFALAEYVKD